jgi:hypothetical protein
MPCRILLVLLLLASPLFADAPTTRPAHKSLFDPARHMRVSEVRIGMKGYGVSVFKGTKLERFDVEVLAVLKNFNPKYDVVLITCHGQNLEHTGAIAGMSGSPIYLQDDTGKYRMIGAFAYGWPLSKDPIAGVQPIEYMLAIDDTPQPPHVAIGAAHAAKAEARAHWSLKDVYPLLSPSSVHRSSFIVQRSGMTALATPLMTAGLSASVERDLAPWFDSYNLTPLQSGGASSQPTEPPAKLEPGAALAVPLLTGDVDFTAIGTVTEVIDNHVFGFGHPFNNEGPISMPLASGEIAAVIPNLQTSFKMGSLTKIRGTLTADQAVGVAGQIGPSPAMIPIDIEIIYADGSVDKHYHFDAIIHPKFTPLLAAAAIGSAVTGSRELPMYHTLDYDLNLEFENGHTTRIHNLNVNGGANELFTEIGVPLVAASENPFQRVQLKRLSGVVKVSPQASEASILSVNVPRLKVRPGETLKGYITYRPFRSAESIQPITFELPKDLAEGTYDLVVSDWQRYLQDETTARPFRFSADQISDVFAVIDEVTSIRHDAIYIRLVRQADGVAIGRTAMPHLPSSFREVMLGSGRSNTTAFVSSTVKTIPTQYVMSGAADFQIVIDKDAKLGTATGKQEPAKPSK